MQGLRNHKIFILVLLSLVCAKYNYGQEHSKSINGTWTGTDVSYKSVMKLRINTVDSSFSEIVSDLKSKKINSIYKAKFYTLNDSVLILIKNKSVTSHKFRLMSDGTLKFYAMTNKLKESIPLLYVFAFRRN